MRCTANGADVYYEQRGHGQDILLLHGWGCSMELFKPVMERLCQRARVTALDFPGHGQSGRPPVPWGAEDFAEMTAEVIRALGIEGCDIIAHSHGGRTAAVLAAKHPELVGKMVLVAASGLRSQPTKAQRRRSARYRLMRDISGLMDRAKVFGKLPERLRGRLRQRYGSRDYNALDDEMRKTFVKLVTFDLSGCLPAIQSPTLLIWGDQDTETPLWMGQRMEKEIPDAGLAVLKGGTHFAYLEKLNDFMRIVEHFLFGGQK